MPPSLFFIRPLGRRGVDEKCASCESKLERRYRPMREWNMKGPLCGACYSKLIAEFYPGDHVRMGSQDDGGGSGSGASAAAGPAGGGPGAADASPGGAGGSGGPAA